MRRLPRALLPCALIAGLLLPAAPAAAHRGDFDIQGHRGGLGLTVESTMGAPPGTDSTAGSRDCTTTWPCAMKETAIGWPTTWGTFGSDDEPASIELLQVLGMIGALGSFGALDAPAAPVSAPTEPAVPVETPAVPAAPVMKSGGGTGPPKPLCGRQGPCSPSFVQPMT